MPRPDPPNSIPLAPRQGRVRPAALRGRAQEGAAGTAIGHVRKLSIPLADALYLSAG